MLKSMRSNFQHLKWILVFVIVVFVAFVFVEWGAGGAGTGGSATEAFAAKVNGETIAINEFARTLTLMERQYEQVYGQSLTPEMIEAMGLPRQVLNGMIDQKLLLQEAARLDMQATPEEVRKQILEIPTLNPDGKFIGDELYQRYVRANLGYNSAADFEREIARDLTLAKMESALMSAVVVPPQRIEQEYRRRSESASIRYILKPVDPSVVVTVTPAEVDSYYRSNASRFQHPEQRYVKYLLVDTARLQLDARPSEAELRSLYDGSKETFKQGDSVRAQHILIRSAKEATPAEDAAARAKAESVLAQVRAGGDFGALARQYSDDPGSKESGGDLGFFERGRMVPEFENAAFSLQPGQVSDLIKSDFGYHIIKTLDKRQGGYRTFEEVRQELESRSVEQRAKDQARNAILQVKARIDQAKPKVPEEFQKFAGGNVTANDTLWFAKAGQVPGLGRVPELNDWAFRSKSGDIGPVIDTPRGPVIPFLSQSRDAGVTPMAEIKEQAETEAKQAKARELAKQQLAAALAGGFDAAAARMGTTPAVTSVTRDGLISGLTGETRSLVESVMSAKVGAVGGPVVVDQGAVAFQVTEKKPFDAADFQKQKATISEQLRSTVARNTRASLVAKLRSSSEIEVNEELLKANSAAGAAQ